MAAKKIHLLVLTQEEKIFEDDVDLVLAPTTQGQIGILPGHIGLLSQLSTGELFIIKGPTLEALAVSGGFLDIHNNQLTIMTDSAVRAEDINIEKVNQAKIRAEKTLKQKLSQREFTLVEADLRQAVLQLKIAKKRRLPKHSSPV